MTEGDRAPVATREALAARTFVELVDSLVDDFDVIDLLTVLAGRCVELVDAAAAGILLVDGGGHLRVMAASSERVELLELFQLQNDEGPCLDCFRTGRSVIVGDLRRHSEWPSFADESIRVGFPSVCALPLRLNDDVLGGLNLFRAEPVELSQADVTLAQALADVASITIVQARAASESTLRKEQLQHALDSRVAIEQAKGMIAERARIQMPQAFAHLRAFARSTNRGLTDTARAVVEGTADIDLLIRRSTRKPDRYEAALPEETDRR
jgi:GAF domain-containing protein